MGRVHVMMHGSTGEEWHMTRGTSGRRDIKHRLLLDPLLYTHVIHRQLVQHDINIMMTLTSQHSSALGFSVRFAAVRFRLQRGAR